MPTINLRTPIKITVKDAAGVPHEYDLVAGLNEVPAEVADHWYVKKFIVPVAGRAPRTVMPSAQLSAAMMAKAKAATAEITKDQPKAEAPAEPPVPSADAAKAPEPAAKAKS